MDGKISDSFFCELKPKLMGNNIQPPLKEECSFYFSGIDGFEYKVYGFNLSGLLKQGEAQVYDQDGEDFVKGSYVENGVEVSFEFGPIQTFESAYFFGSAEWIEHHSNGTVRQKYSARIWDGSLSVVEKDFLQGVFSQITSLLEKSAELENSVHDSSANLMNLQSKISSSQKDVEKLNEVSYKVNENLSDSKRALEDFQSLENSLRERLDAMSDIEERSANIVSKNEVLVRDLDNVKSEADLVKERADEALGSTITLGLASSFKNRKTEASKLRVVYDIVFGASILIALVILFMLWGWWDVVGESSGGIVSYMEGMAVRLPFLAFPIWLGIYASKKSSSATRIEEFYAQKQALAESYEGYKNEIMKIADSYDDADELLELIRINLVSINRDSAHVFDKASGENHSPWGEVLSRVGPTKRSRPEKGDSPGTDEQSRQ